jgi:hypothetical protein
MSSFFLLRLGKYTMPRSGAVTGKVQFCVQDVRLWKNGILLHNQASRAELMMADAVTLYLENQKNSNKGVTIYHAATTDWFCPVQALVCCVANIAKQGMGLDTPSILSPQTSTSRPRRLFPLFRKQPV